MKYKKLKLEPSGDKQKLRMLQNSVGDVAALSYAKQLGCQVFSASSRGIPGVSRSPFHRNQPERQDMPFEACQRQGNYQYK
jgi:hypothetical protein